ncbi:MAG: glycosyltransferase family 4 protein, partial [Acidimicrobiales bacterium]
MRLANVIHGLSMVGDVELFSLIHPAESGACQVPSRVPLSRYATASRTAVPLTKRRRLAWFARGGVPLELFGRDYRPARAAFGAWARESYDLAWFGDPEALVALGRQVRAPAIVDFDDLEDHTAWLKGHEVGAAGQQSALHRAGTWVADAERLLRHHKNARLWRKLQERAVRSVAAVVVCSELDRTRFGRSSVVIPNGYTLSGPALGRVQVGARPTILLPGYLRYGPNVDAARRLVEDIGPHLWERAPDLQIRLVGLADERITRLNRPPAVVVTGRVEDMATELSRADLLAVPLRYGGGTRIKILEAFAHRIPVVSTTLGAEGLGAVDGRHLLLADDSEAF